jgi:SOS response regulatory protein OraA/RecX
MGCFFYKTFEELLEFAQQQGFDETLPSDQVADVSKEKIKLFLESKGFSAQDINEAMISSGVIQQQEIKEG